MIQRVQTIFIFISIVLMVSMYFWFPAILDETGAMIVERNEPLVAGILIAIVLVSLVAIFSYKNRRRQLVLNRRNILIHIILLGVFVYRLLMLSGETSISEKDICVFKVGS